MQIKYNQLPKAIIDATSAQDRPTKVVVRNAAGPEKEQYELWYGARCYVWKHDRIRGWTQYPSV